MKRAIATALLVAFAAAADPPAAQPPADAPVLTVVVDTGTILGKDGRTYHVAGGDYLPLGIALSESGAIADLRTQNQVLRWLLGAACAAVVVVAGAAYGWGRLSR